jgi:hypothetical protein
MKTIEAYWKTITDSYVDRVCNDELNSLLHGDDDSVEEDEDGNESSDIDWESDADESEDGEETAAGAPDSSRDRLKPGMAECRRYAIQYIFVQLLNEPSENEWRNKDTVTAIMNILDIAPGTRNGVIKTLREIVRCRQEGVSFVAKCKRNRTLLIRENSVEADVIYKGIEKGLSIFYITILVNFTRRSRNLSNVSWSAVES